MKLPRSFYEQATLKVARQLLGKYLVRKHGRGVTVGRIVETEAYIGTRDQACHASRGRTRRTEVMFGAAGTAYVYLIYGFYHCLNAVTERVDYPAAVLIRALEPVEGIPLMRARRGTEDLRSLASGPGKLCQALAIDRSLNGADLCGSHLYVEDRGDPDPSILRAPRIGVDYAGPWKDKRWRFLMRGSSFLSRP
ncbi:MAG TPA: DNA-3-methyladenine glycosylase [Candidatus Binatia bacterium]